MSVPTPRARQCGQGPVGWWEWGVLPVRGGQSCWQGARAPTGSSNAPLPPEPCFGAVCLLRRVPARGCNECSTFSAFQQPLAGRDVQLRRSGGCCAWRTENSPQALAFINGLVFPVDEGCPCSRSPPSPIVPVRGLRGSSPHRGHPRRPTGSGENWCGEEMGRGSGGCCPGDAIPQAQGDSGRGSVPSPVQGTALGVPAGLDDTGNAASCREQPWPGKEVAEPPPCGGTPARPPAHVLLPL